MKGDQQHRDRIIGNARTLLREIEQQFTDLAAWNEHSVARQRGAAPIDPDPDGSLRALADGLRRMLAADPGIGPIPPLDLPHDTTIQELIERVRHTVIR